MPPLICAWCLAPLRGVEFKRSRQAFMVARWMLVDARMAPVNRARSKPSTASTGCESEPRSKDAPRWVLQGHVMRAHVGLLMLLLRSAAARVERSPARQQQSARRRGGPRGGAPPRVYPKPKPMAAALADVHMCTKNEKKKIEREEDRSREGTSVVICFCLLAFFTGATKWSRLRRVFYINLRFCVSGSTTCTTHEGKKI